ncbi:MAG TPA: L-threonylcarbamoyladenylate synthase [Dehalococcoidia bacterium]|nr:L-threonylcarbamoyladenylate synthase [Dehalococcoidia bacterium]
MRGPIHGMAAIVSATDPACTSEAVALLRRGELVCYPTDTVYGIGAAAGNEAAVRRLYAVKGRAPDKPLPLLIADTADAQRLADVTPGARTLMARFWPGALTIVLRKTGDFRSLALAGRDTVALRVPDDSLVRALVRRLGEPLTGTSANRAGAPPPVSASEVALQMGDMVSLIIDGGPCRRRVESTVVDLTQDGPRILREGPVSKQEIEEALGRPVGA